MAAFSLRSNKKSAHSGQVLVKPKVVLMANTTWNIYNFRLNIIDKFLEKGYDVAIVAPVDEYLEYKEHYPMVQHFNVRTLSRDSKNPLRDLLLMAELTRRYRKLKPDLVIHYTNKPNIYGGVAAALAGIPSIAVVTGLGYAFIKGGLIRDITSFLYRFTSRFHKRFIFENTEDALLFEKLHILPPGKGFTIKGCGVDTEFYRPTAATDNRRMKTVFTFIGRLLKDKGIREFISAAQLLKKTDPQLEFVIVGELDDENPTTIDREDLMDWVNNNTVTYHGFQKDIRPFISNSDCIVLPSYREGLPRIIMEGMSMAKAVITTDTAGCRETVEEGVNGYLVPIRNAEKLADAMRRFAALSAEEKITMGRAGRTIAVSQFDHRKIAHQFYNLVANVK